MNREIKNRLVSDYAKIVAKLEMKFLNFTDNDITTSDENLRIIYDDDKSLRAKHIRLLNYMNSTIARFVILRLVVSEFYAQNLCINATLLQKTNFTRNAIADVINTAESEGWIYKKINPMNKNQTLILPTSLRIVLWEKYCLARFYDHDKSNINSCHQMLKAVTS